MNPYKTIQITNFADSEYVKIPCKKTQLVLHFGANSDNAGRMFEGWKNDGAQRATAYGMEDSGTIYQGFDDKYYAAHVGYHKGNARAKAHPIFGKYHNRPWGIAIEQRTIGIEICNWGALKLINGQYHTWVSKAVNPIYKVDSIVPEDQVIEYPELFRGMQYFQRFTDKEIESLGYWLKEMGAKHNIPLKYNPKMWDLCEDAIKGVPGFYCHVSYHAEKQDLHPQPNLVEMFNTL